MKRAEFEKLAAAEGITLNIENLRQAVGFAMKLKGNRPRLDDVRNWCGLDFSSNHPEAVRIRTERGR